MPGTEDKRSVGGDDVRAVVYRVHETFRFLRWCVICGTILIGLWLVIDAIKEIAKQPVPPWLYVVTVLASILAPAAVIRIQMRVKKRDFELTVAAEQADARQLPANNATSKANSHVEVKPEVVVLENRLPVKS